MIGGNDIRIESVVVSVVVVNDIRIESVVVSVVVVRRDVHHSCEPKVGSIVVCLVCFIVVGVFIHACKVACRVVGVVGRGDDRSKVAVGIGEVVVVTPKISAGVGVIVFGVHGPVVLIASIDVMFVDKWLSRAVKEVNAVGAASATREKMYTIDDVGWQWQRCPPVAIETASAG